MQTCRQQPAASPRLVDQWTSHLKFNGREPRTLLELGIARAEHEHRRRVAELKVISKKLEQFDALLPRLLERGIKLQYRDFQTFDGGKSVTLFAGSSTDQTLYRALLDIGFREVERKPYMPGRSDRVRLKHGRALLLDLEVPMLPVIVAAKAEEAGVPA